VQIIIILSLNTLQEYLKLRTAHITGLKDGGDNPYPHKFHVSISLTEFVEKYGGIADGEQHVDVVSVAGKKVIVLLYFICCISLDIVNSL